MSSADGRATPVGPALRWLLRALYLLTGVLTATAVYLGAVTAAEFVTGASYQGYVYQWAVLVHLAVGVVIVLPFIAFAPAHALAAWTHPNRRAARMGYVLAGLAVVVLVTGVGLMRVAGLDLRDPGMRALVYWAHVLAPIGVAWAFANHRRRGRALAGRGGLDVGDGHGGAGRPDRRHRRAHQPVAGGHRRRGELRAVAVAHRQRPGDPGIGA